MNIAYGVFIGLLAAGLLWLVTGPPRGQAVTLLPPPTPAPLTEEGQTEHRKRRHRRFQ